MGGRTGRTAASAANLEKTLEKLGGEELLRRSYPALYKAVLHTRETLKKPVCKAAAAGADYIFGAEDSCKIRTLNYAPDATLESSSGIATDKPKASLAIIGDISDAVTGKSIDGFAVSDSNSDELTAESITPAASLSGRDTGRFIAKSSFIVVEYDAEGKPVVKTLDSAMEAVKVLGGEYIVKSLEVTAPMPVKHPGADRTRVYYNRKGTEADYDYSNVKYSSTEIDVYMPFSGRLELNGIYLPDPVCPVVKDGENGLVLQIENVRNGAANFDMKYWDDIKWTVSGSVLTWEFPENWHDVLSKQKLSYANDMNFYCKMFVNTTIGIPVPIVIQSAGSVHPDPSYQKIPFIDILWGCFAKDVLIRMGDGSCKPVERIVAGDRVWTKDGAVCEVRDVVRGNEESLIFIETSSQSRIRVTMNHPLLTVEGLVRADQLTAGSILVTEDGEVSIESLYLVPYQDTVYNLMLDQEALLSANGFYAGDFTAQNRKAVTRRKAVQKQEDFQEELTDLIGGIHRSKKERL